MGDGAHAHQHTQGIPRLGSVGRHRRVNSVRDHRCKDLLGLNNCCRPPRRFRSSRTPSSSSLSPAGFQYCCEKIRRQMSGCRRGAARLSGAGWRGGHARGSLREKCQHPPACCLGPASARKRLAIGKPAGETVSKFLKHDGLLWRSELRPRAWVGRKRKASRVAHARSQGLRWLLGQPTRLSLSQADCPTHPMPRYLRMMAASRYSHGRKEFFISAKWISAGTI